MTKGVYFILDRENDVIKIGYSNNIKKRLANLQTGNASELKLFCSWLELLV